MYVYKRIGILHFRHEGYFWHKLALFEHFILSQLEGIYDLEIFLGVGKTLY